MVNDGNLCVKGRFAYDFIHHADRLTEPLKCEVTMGSFMRHRGGMPLILFAHGGLWHVREKYGKDALGFVSSSRCTGEENYLMQKLARAAFGTNNCHQCAAP
ncbi:MAG: hypothetical protein R3C68_16305 [Myxococcota bacterium]